MKIYIFVKKSLKGRKLNIEVLQEMSKKYYLDGKSYSKSIELFKNDLDKKTFTAKYKKYRELNKEKIK